MRRLLLRNFQAPGDVLMLTAAVRDLHRAYPGKFATAVHTAHHDLWLNNPHVITSDDALSPDEAIDCEYPLIHESNRRPLHFIHGFAEDLGRKLNISIPIIEFRGDIHLSNEERESACAVESVGYGGPYWVVVAGGKHDFTTKWWNPDSYQAVVDHFAGRIKFVQCGQRNDHHFTLKHVIDLVGQTNLREFIRIIYKADGVLCPVTFAMHLAAAVPTRTGARLLRPCVVIAGGREPPHWEMYPGHQFLHTMGALSCCQSGGCWKSRCQPHGDNDPKDQDLCEKPVRIRDDLKIARCMNLITPAHAINAIELFLTEAEAMDSSETHASDIYDDVHHLKILSNDVQVTPRGVAVTIATGHFKEIAELAAVEVRARSGLDTIVLNDRHLAESGLESPLFLKFRLFDLVDAENIFYFDGDQVCLERWDPRSHFGSRSIVAVRDRMVDSILAEAKTWGIPPEDYFNGGMFIANRQHHHQWLQHAEGIRFLHQSALFDQSPLNAARVRLGIPLKLLDRRHNWLGFGASSLSHDMPVIHAHKLAPNRLDLNLAYLRGENQLLAPTIAIEDSEAELLCGRTFLWKQQDTILRQLTFRDDGTLLPIASPEAPGYWFVHVVQGTPRLALASETCILHEFVEALGGDWINTSDDSVRLVDVIKHQLPPLTEETARLIADQSLAAAPPYPPNTYRGRGIVICAGGNKYLPCAWVCIKMLRKLGCTLPIELWQLRASEISADYREAISPLGVTIVSAAEVRRKHPVRHLGGWELKPYAILHSSFEQVLLLDADNVPVVNPEFLFDSSHFQSTGAIFWPDFNKLSPDRAIWRICKVDWQEEAEFESGQILVNKHRCWQALQMTMHLNEHSDFYYRYIHGDKETFHMAWRMLGKAYSMVPRYPQSLTGAMCQHDFAGLRIFQHRNSAKWRLNGNPHVQGFEQEEECLAWLDELRNCAPSTA